jgi:hypothetical protein
MRADGQTQSSGAIWNSPRLARRVSPQNRASQPDRRPTPRASQHKVTKPARCRGSGQGGGWALNVHVLIRGDRHSEAPFYRPSKIPTGPRVHQVQAHPVTVARCEDAREPVGPGPCRGSLSRFGLRRSSSCAHCAHLAAEPVRNDAGGVEQRLELIELRVFWARHVRRIDVTQAFGVLPPLPQVVNDGLERDDCGIPEFSPHASAPTPVKGVEPVTFRAIVGAIRGSEAIAFTYESRSSPERRSRSIAPRQVAFDGFPGHRRGLCRAGACFKDLLSAKPRLPTTAMGINAVMREISLPRPLGDADQGHRARLREAWRQGDAQGPARAPRRRAQAAWARHRSRPPETRRISRSFVRTIRPSLG